jgi:hypothetical protein
VCVFKSQSVNELTNDNRSADAVCFRQEHQFVAATFRPAVLDAPNTRSRSSTYATAATER